MASNNLRSRQMNPCDHLFWKSRGYPERPRNWQQLLEDMGYYDDDTNESETSSDEYYSEYETESEESYESDDYDEHRTKSNQNNPNNDEYWQARGWTQRPDDWRERINGRLPLCNTKQSENPKAWWKNEKNRV